MDIHKPKPWHSFREFLKEYLIIVVGVLTALAGEQAVEWVHWRHVTDETRRSLNDELGYDIGIVHWRADHAACMSRRLAELRVVFDRHAGRQPLGLARPFGQPNFAHLRTAAWETALSDQSLSHMPPDLRLRYARAYEGIAWFRDKEAAETEAWTHLRQIDDAAVMLDQDWAALHQWKIHAESLQQKVDPGLLPRAFFADDIEALGVKPRYGGSPQVRALTNMFCQPLT